MSTMSAIRTITLFIVMLAGVPAINVTSAWAVEEVYAKDGVALGGYDPVAYFTAGQPEPGVDQFTAKHEGATYKFVSAANRDAFVANPSKYAPQYGGYCAFGTAMGRKFGGDPKVWRIVDGRLFLNLNADVQQRWVKDVPGFVRGADNNWPKIKSHADAQLEKTVPAGVTIGAQ